MGFEDDWIPDEADYSISIPDIAKHFDDILSKPNLIILGARPGMGKSMLALNVALELASKSKNVLYFTNEERSNISFSLSCLTRILLRNIDCYEITGKEFLKIQEAKKYLKSMPLMFASDDMIHCAQKENDSLDLVIILDCLQEITSRNSLLNIMTRLKELSIELNVPIIITSKLSRKPENRSNHKPRISDLKAPKAIADIADVIMLLYRAEYYWLMNERLEKCLEMPNEIRDKIDIIIAKNKHGETRTIQLPFHGEYYSIGYNNNKKSLCRRM